MRFCYNNDMSENKRDYRPDQTEWVLDFLAEAAHLPFEIMDAFFDSSPSSFSRKKSSSIELSESRIPSPEERQRFYSLLSRLKTQGLIEKKDRWKVTKEGLQKLFVIREKKKFSPKSALHEPKKDSVVRVVIFDVPERERHKRVWLRAALLALDFSLCQQSVWIGKSKISKKFLEDLRDREMLSYVQIFEVSKKGSLEKMDLK